MQKIFSLFFLSFILLSVIGADVRAQLTADQLTPDSYVKLQLLDSSEFYVLVLGKPVPDRIIVETHYGELEIPLSQIAGAIDYRYNWVQKEDLKRAALKSMADAQKYEVTKFLSKPKMPDTSTVATKDHDLFKGRRYLFDDTAHVILSTDFGNLFFTYPDLDYVDNWSGQGDRREDFTTALYYTAKDPISSQDFLLPTGRSFGAGNVYLSDYMVAGLQANYGPTDWLSINAGGLLLPFLPTGVTAITGGLKLTPYGADPFNVSVGFQEAYSKVVKQNSLAFPYLAVTYGTWESELTLLAGEAYQNNDSLGVHTYPKDSFIGAAGDMRVGENLKVAIEFYFIEDFGIVPTVFSVRYFDNNLTIDAGVVFSLYKAGADQSKSLGDYVFNTPFAIVPVVAGSYHF